MKHRDLYINSRFTFSSQWGGESKPSLPVYYIANRTFLSSFIPFFFTTYTMSVSNYISAREKNAIKYHIVLFADIKINNNINVKNQLR
ncbi:MAG: hypothetical protein LBO06_02600 [Bacteroidales bacterium]|nr:hypothetical protein [Bacteroidales bacterium]